MSWEEAMARAMRIVVNTGNRPLVLGRRRYGRWHYIAVSIGPALMLHDVKPIDR